MSKTQRIRLVYEFDVMQDTLDFCIEAVFDHIESFDSVRLVKIHAEIVDAQEEGDVNDRTALQGIHRTPC